MSLNGINGQVISTLQKKTQTSRQNNVQQNTTATTKSGIDIAGEIRKRYNTTSPESGLKNESQNPKVDKFIENYKNNPELRENIQKVQNKMFEQQSPQIDGEVGKAAQSIDKSKSQIQKKQTVTNTNNTAKTYQISKSTATGASLAGTGQQIQQSFSSIIQNSTSPLQNNGYHVGGKDLIDALDNARMESNISKGGIGYEGKQTYFSNTRKALDKMSNSRFGKGVQNFTEKAFKPFNAIEGAVENVSNRAANGIKRGSKRFLTKMGVKNPSSIPQRMNKFGIKALEKAKLVRTTSLTTLSGGKVEVTLSNSKLGRTVSTFARSGKTAFITKTAGRVAIAYAAADAMWETGDTFVQKGTIAGVETGVKTTSAVAAAWAGGQIGATLLAPVFPPIGSIVGGFAGGVIGYFAGSKAGQALGEMSSKAMSATVDMLSKSPTGRKIIAGAQKAAGVAKKYVGKAMDTAREAWNGVKSGAKKAWNGVKSTAKKAWNGVKNTAKKAYNKAKSTAKEAVKHPVKTAKKVAKTAVNYAKKAAKKVASWFGF